MGERQLLRGFYTAASGMITGQRRQETLSNNLANAQTPGFKQDRAQVRAFPELLINRMEKESVPTTRSHRLNKQTPIGYLNTGVYVQETIADHAQGGLKETGMTTDMALVNGRLADEMGSLFFTVQNADGDIGYSRNGNFTIDGQGYLTTNQGYYLLDQAGQPIFTDGQAFSVTSEGEIEIAGTTLPLNIAYVANVNDLIKDDEDLFRFTDGDQAVDARGLADVSFSVQQGFLENSNVDQAQTMGEMMQAYRLFETNQAVLRAYDQSLDIAVNQIGRLT